MWRSHPKRTGTSLLKMFPVLCLEEFMNYTGLGRGSAMKLGKEIGCVMKVGKRALYDTRKADLYFDSLTGVK